MEGNAADVANGRRLHSPCVYGVKTNRLGVAGSHASAVLQRLLGCADLQPTNIFGLILDVVMLTRSSHVRIALGDQRVDFSVRAEIATVFAFMASVMGSTPVQTARVRGGERRLPSQPAIVTAPPMIPTVCTMRLSVSISRLQGCLYPISHVIDRGHDL